MVLEAAGSSWSGKLTEHSGLGRPAWIRIKGVGSVRHFPSTDSDFSHLRTAKIWVSCRPTSLHGMETVLMNHTD